MVNCILDDLKFRKVNLIETSLPLSLKETESQAIEVIMKNQITGDISTP